MFSRRKIVRDFAKIQLIIVLSWCLPATLPRAHASSGRCRIAAVHSYEKNYRDAGRYRYLLEKELAAKGLKAEIREFFLNCNELIYEDELARAPILSTRRWSGAPTQSLYSTIRRFTRC